MPGANGEKLYGLPGPQNSAVLMDIISKLKQDLQHSRLENNKLVDQLNCLIALVKRAWSGEQGATMHLANIVGMDVPNFSGQDMNRNTPMPEKSRAVRNWERFTIRLLEREYMAIQQEIQEKQKLYIQNRQVYMNEVMEDHNQEMSKYALHRKGSASVEEVDRKFMRCFSAKTRGSKKVKAGYRPRSAYQSKPHTAADMAERADVTVGEMFGQQMSPRSQHQNGSTNMAFNGLYRSSSAHNDRRLYRPREQFDDPNRYKPNNLFDPDVIFSPEMMEPPRDIKNRPLSATMTQKEAHTSLRTRPKSAVFITESKAERPLKYETTRPISGKNRPTGTAAFRGRQNSAPARRAAPTSINKKELHSRHHESQQRPTDEHGNNDQNVHETENQHIEETNPSHVTTDIQGDEDEAANEMTPMRVRVKKTDPVDQFVEDLKLMGEMEMDFKKSAIQLQKRLGIETDGIVY